MKKIILAASAAALVLMSLSGCAKSGTTCADFMAQSEAQQKETMDAWGKEKKLVGPGSLFTSEMRDYCSDSTHSDDQLNDLTFGIG